MHFYKLQGAGNDYICIDCFEETVLQPNKLSRWLSDRHFGLGSDGMILLCPPSNSNAQCRMQMYNADGSEGAMCGNGIRMVAHLWHYLHHPKQTEMIVETLAGDKAIAYLSGEEKQMRFAVDMGEPHMKLQEIEIPKEKLGSCQGEPLEALFWCKTQGKVLCADVDVGNPHCVVYVKKALSQYDLPSIGGYLERHSCFPKGANVEFVEVVSEDTLRMRVWERGSGETLSCGTGSCAAAYATQQLMPMQSHIQVICAGGSLGVEWMKQSRHVFLDGDTRIICEGDCYEDGVYHTEDDPHMI